MALTFRSPIKTIAVHSIRSFSLNAMVRSTLPVASRSCVVMFTLIDCPSTRTVLSESPLHYRFAGGFVLIVPSVLFIFAVRRYLFAMWGIASR